MIQNDLAGYCHSEQSHILRPEHMNSQSRLFGGQLLEWIDEIAGIAARRYCKCNITTACIDKLEFLAPAHFNETLTLVAAVTYVGTTSMEVTVKTYAERLDGTTELVNVAHLVEVALDKKEKPVKVPEFVITSDEMRESFEKGRLRKENRKIRIEYDF